jgi:hypothetical protein
LEQIALMQKILISLAAGFLAAGVSAQSLQLDNVNYPGIYCRFSPNCSVSPTEQSDSFAPTNLAATCVLESRSFPGSSMDSAGRYGYEYRLVLNNAGATGTNFLTIDSLTLHCGAPDYFAFGEHASNQVWVVTTGGPGDIAPASADAAKKKITFSFSPPLVLATETNQNVSTYYFGMISTNAPKITMAILSGSAQADTNEPVSFEAELQARAP